MAAASVGGGTSAGSEARRYGKTAGLLSVGVGATGLITYIYFALASHNLGRTEYGELVVLWAVIFITVSVLYRPVEQLLSRTIAERDARGTEVGGPIRIAATIQAGLALGFGAAALALREPLQEGLLSGEETLYWVMVGAVLAYAASYFARGLFAGSRRFALYATLMLFESISRTGFAVAVALGIASGQSVVVLGIVAAPLISLAVVPVAVARGIGRGSRASGPASRARVDHGHATAPAGNAAAGRGAPIASTAPREPAFTVAHGGGFAAAVLLIMLSEQAFLNAGPLLVRATEGAAAAGFIFNVLMIARAPLQLFQAVATSLLPHLTRLRSSGLETGEEAFRLSIRTTMIAIAGFAALVAAAVLVAGPQLMQLAFGEKFDYDRPGLLIVTAGMAMYLVGATLNQAAVAQGQVRRAAACWIAAATLFVGWTLLPVLDVVRRVEVGFAGGAAILAVLLYLLYRRPHARPQDVPTAGSPEELEARLAAADEAS